MVLFEGNKLRIPIGVDLMLIRVYGDYMTPPPKSEQVSHHINKVFQKPN